MGIWLDSDTVTPASDAAIARPSSPVLLGRVPICFMYGLPGALAAASYEMFLPCRLDFRCLERAAPTCGLAYTAPTSRSVYDTIISRSMVSACASVLPARFRAQWTYGVAIHPHCGSDTRADTLHPDLPL